MKYKIMEMRELNKKIMFINYYLSRILSFINFNNIENNDKLDRI